MIAETDVGEIAAIDFLNFVSLKNDVPNLQGIVDGEDVEVPDECGLMYATIVALVTVLKEASDIKISEYFENAVAYVDKIPTPEYGIFFVRSIVQPRPELKETSTYSEFKVRNQDLEV